MVEDGWWLGVPGRDEREFENEIVLEDEEEQGKRGWERGGVVFAIIFFLPKGPPTIKCNLVCQKSFCTFAYSLHDFILFGPVLNDIYKPSPFSFAYFIQAYI